MQQMLPRLPPQSANKSPWSDGPAQQTMDSPSLGYPTSLRAMVDLDYTRSSELLERRRRVDRLGAHPDLLDFERILCKRFDRLGIPLIAELFVRSAVKRLVHGDVGPFGPYEYGCAVSIVHATMGVLLTPQQWDLIGHAGKEVCLTRGKRIDIAWGGDAVPFDDVEPDPSHWELNGWESVAYKFPFVKGR